MKNKDILSIRREYAGSSFDKTLAHPDPIIQFSEWFGHAIEADLPEVNAMTLATVSPQGQPSARVVLLKDFGVEGFVFFTNYESVKGQHLAQNPRAALVFFWAELYRQVRLEGTIHKVSDKESDNYFATRPRESQIGAIASQQSKVIPGRTYLEELFHCMDEKFAGKTPTRPPQWGGYRLKPTWIEFWQGRTNRLNDRLLYEKKENEWHISRLAP